MTSSYAQTSEVIARSTSEQVKAAPATKIGWFSRVHFTLSRAAFAYPCLIPMLMGVVLGLTLAQRRFGLFSTSFMNRAALDPIRMVAYVFGLILTEGLQVLLLWTVMLMFAKLLRLRDKTLRIAYLITACIGVVLLKFLAFEVLGYLGDFFRARVVTKISDGTGGALPYVMGYLNGQLPMIALLILLFTCGAAVVWWLGRAMGDRPLPRIKAPMLGTLGLLMAVLVTQVGMIKRPYDPLTVQLNRVPVYALAGAGLAGATDFDGDGTGWLAKPADFAPWDASRHPFAAEVPGNGIDENGYAGDLPVLSDLEEPIVAGEPVTRPDILLVIECTMRHDLVDLDIDGRPVMPFVRRLGATGYLAKAYSHQGSTIPGICAILTGDPVHFHQSLVADFKQRGYHTIAALAGDDLFGDIGRRTGMDQVDQMFHAGMAVEDRITISAASSSLTISSERVIRDFDRMLKDAPRDQPVFAVVFLASLHYPYSLDAPDQHFETKHVPISGFKPGNRDAMMRMYNNAAANLDVQLEKLHGLWTRARAHRGTPTFALIGDHGESFYCDDSFGHGLELTDAQTGTLLLLHGGWGEVPEPVGQSDLRGMLLNMLTDPYPQPGRYEVVQRERPVFQIIGHLGQPFQIGWVDQDGRSVVDFTRDLYTDPAGKATPLDQLPPNSAGLQLIYEWETRLINKIRRQQSK